MKYKIVIVLAGFLVSPLCVWSQEDLFHPRQRNDLQGCVTDGHGQPLTESVTNLVLLMEPGHPHWNNSDFQSSIPWKESAQFQPLGGVEPLPAARLAARVTLRVIDADTQAAIPAYHVTPGWTFGRNLRPAWLEFKEQTLHTSDRPIEVEKRSGPAYLRISAEGHLPTNINVEGKIDQALTVTLHPGEGVAGVVMQPDGQPASAAQVVMLNRPDHSSVPLPVSLHKGRFNSSMLHGASPVQTDPEGHFAFAPAPEIFPLLIAHESGFAVLENPQPGAASTIHLQPWARISGSIRDFNENSEMFISLSAQRPHLSEDPKESKQ